MLKASMKCFINFLTIYIKIDARILNKIFTLFSSFKSKKQQFIYFYEEKNQ